MYSSLRVVSWAEDDLGMKGFDCCDGGGRIESEVEEHQFLLL